MTITLKKKSYENIVGKEENAGNQHFLLFPQCFPPYSRQKSSFQLNQICCQQMLSILFHPKFCRLVKSHNNVQGDYVISCFPVFEF